MAAPRIIARFQLEGAVAFGGVGTIHRARDLTTGETVAVKVIRDLAAADAVRFAREGQALAKIRHPGVVRHIEHGIAANGEAYLVMEWLEGEDVRARLDRTGLTMSESIDLGRRVAEALAVIHGHGLVHRDVKPANLFLPGGRVEDVKIIDFGLARLDDTSAGPTVTGLVVGTPSYMAPEQARGQRDLDARADIFSLGCVLYKCLAGRSPFEGESVMAVLTKVLFEESPRLSALGLAVPAALDDLITRMLAKDRQARPPTMTGVAEELAALGPLVGLSAAAQPSLSSRPSLGLTGVEQRLVAMLLIGAAAAQAPSPSDTGTLPEGRRTHPSVDLTVDRVVHDHGGSMEQLVGGTRVVLLAVTALVTDQAARAARCALALHALLPEAPMALSAAWSETGQTRPLGDAIDRAAKLLDEPGEAAAIVVDGVVAALLDQRFEVTARRGKLYLEGLRELSRGVRTLLGKATPLMGRDWELSSIATLFQSCIDEQAARVLLITAPAGMGKSRLAHEAVRMLRLNHVDLTMWTGRGDPLRAGSALGLLGEALRSATGIHESMPLQDRRRRISERVDQHLPTPTANRVEVFLGEIMGAPFDDAASAELRAARKDPRLMGQQMQQAWEDFLAAECAAHPVLLVLEDLHWGDLPTTRLVDDALKRLVRAPWMVLALARPEVHEAFPRLWADRHLQEIRLSPLSRRVGERLVRLVLGDTVSAEKAARVAAQGDGNAFYLEELIRAVADQKRSDEDSQPLPETVLAMVQARLDGLDSDTRRVLRAASVFGEVFWPGGVAALLGGGTGPLPTSGWASDLTARELLVQHSASRFDGEPELSFRHALLREGAYAMLTADDRALGHRLAGEWLVERGERDALLLAHHFDLGREPARAAGFYLRASVQALRGADTDAAIKLAEQALAVGLDDPHRIACLDALCEGYLYRNDLSRCAECATALKLLAAPASAAWIHAHALGARAMLALGRYPEFFESLTVLKSVDPTLETIVEVAQGLYIGIACLIAAAQLPLVIGILDRLDEVVAPFASCEPMAHGFAQWAHARVESCVTGDAWAALGYVEAALASFQEVHDRGRGQFVELERAQCLHNLGMFEEAERRLRAVEVDGDRNLVTVLRWRCLAGTLVELDAVDEACSVAGELIASGRARRYPDDLVNEAEGHWVLSEIAFRKGDFDAAARELGEVFEPLRAVPLYWPLATARLAAVELARGRTAEALALAREAVTASSAQGGFGLRGGLARLVHAEALYASGDRAAASQEITAARDALRARAAKIPDPAARRIFLERVRDNARTLTLAEAWLGDG